MLVDQARIHVQAGKGGNGSSSFRREKFIPKGGPDGGDGGHGGDVILKVVPNLNSLLPFQFVHAYRAEDGGAGAGRNKHGRKGSSTIVKVPPGTMIILDDTGEQIADLTESGEEFVVARGGKGGLGNIHFKSSTRQSPKIAELGEPGEHRWLRLELRLIADVGLVGLPNAGKSTLLAASTRAKPKIADYPFTTLSPNLGVVTVGGLGGQAFVIADIPGLIEGAAGGAGLGHEFLRHVQRTRVLVHVLDASGGLEARDPLVDFHGINAELAAFDPAMGVEPMLVALNKIDLPEAQSQMPRLRAALEAEGYSVYPISAATGEGTTELFAGVAERLREIVDQEAAERKDESAKPKRRVYTIGNIDERAWEAMRVEDGVYRVSGVGVERFTRMTNFDLREGGERFQRMLDRTGIAAELERLGIEDGDTVFIANHEMLWGNPPDDDGAFVLAGFVEPDGVAWDAEE